MTRTKIAERPMLRAFSIGRRLLYLSIAWPWLGHAATFELNYAASPGCPSKQTLVSSVLARTNLADPVQAAGAYRFDVSIERSSEQSVHGTLTVRLPSGKVSSRILDGGSCDEVVSAMAVIIALRLDPGANQGTVDVAAPTHAPNSDATPTVPSVTRAPLPESTSENALGTAIPSKHVVPKPNDVPQRTPLDPRRARPFVAAPSRPKAGQSSDDTSWALEAGLHVDWSSLLAPGWGLFRGGAGLSYRMPRGPVVSVAASAWPSTPRSNDDGLRASLAYYGGSLGCGWNVWNREFLALDAFGITQLGGLRAQGEAGPVIEAGRVQTAISVTAGPGLELRANTLWGGWAVHASTPISIVRPRFIVTSSNSMRAEYFEAPFAGVQLGLRIYFRIYGS